MVLAALPEINKVAVPPSNDEAIETAPRPSTVPVPLLLLTDPSVSAREPVAMRALVLLKYKICPLFLLMTILFRVRVGGIVRKAVFPTNTTVPLLGLKVP